MISFFQQMAAKIISIIAGLIIAMGMVEMPAEYQPPLDISLLEFDTSSVEIEKIPGEYTTETQIETGQENKTVSRKTEQKINPPPILPIIPPQQVQQPKESPDSAPAPQISLIALNKNARGAIVNILCTTKTAGAFRPITGSGIVINPEGIILINAHMGEYFLLEDEPLAGYLNCIIRNGDIAAIAYDAKLLYIPSAWVEKNSQSIIEQKPKGTGEDDYALLFINKSLVENKGPPSLFPFGELNFNFGDLPENLSVLIASYPAEFLGGISVQKELGLLSTFAPVKALYTFSEYEPANLDIFSLGGNIASQAGSSGGGVFDTRDGKLLGIIVTSNEGTTTASKILSAITIPHISRSFRKHTGHDFADFLNNPESWTDVFPETEFNRLKNILLEQLKKL